MVGPVDRLYIAPHVLSKYSDLARLEVMDYNRTRARREGRKIGPKPLLAGVYKGIYSYTLGVHLGEINK